MNVLERRFHEGLTLAAAAAGIGIARQTLSYIEKRPSVPPSGPVARKIATFYGCEPHDIWRLDDSDDAAAEAAAA